MGVAWQWGWRGSGGGVAVGVALQWRWRDGGRHLPAALTPPPHAPLPAHLTRLWRTGRSDKLEPTIAAIVSPFVGKLQVQEIELVFPLLEPSAAAGATPRVFRIICTLAPTFQIMIFEEIETEALSPSPVELRPLLAPTEQPIGLEPYQLLTIVDQKRLKCQKLATTYAYDYISTFEVAVAAAWEKAPAGCGT